MSRTILLEPAKPWLGLNRHEESEYQRFYWEFIQWLDSDEEVGDLLEKAGYDHFKQSTKKHS